MALEADWAELLRGCSSHTVFATWEWMSTWWRCLGEACALRVWTIREAPGQPLLALVPLVLRRRRCVGIPCRQLALLGGGEAAADHLDLIVRDGALARVAPVMLECLNATRREADVVNMEGVADQAPTLAPWLSAFSRNGRRERVRCPYIELPETWEAYLAGLDGKTRSSLGRHARLLDRDHAGRTAYRLAETSDAVEAGMDHLVRLHQASQARHGRPGAFRDARLHGFHRAIARRFLARGWLRLMLMSVGNEVIAANYGFAYRGICYEYSKGHAPAWQHYGPGMQLNARTIREAIARRDRGYDLLRGDEPYKLKLSTRTRDTLAFQASLNARGALLLSALDWQRRTWPLARWVRAKAQRAATLMAGRSWRGNAPARPTPVMEGPEA